jgi:hypothetical protein
MVLFVPNRKEPEAPSSNASATMTKFLVLYHSTTSVQEQMAAATPEQMKAGMDAWMAWAKKAGSAVVDLGMPLMSAKQITAASVKDGRGTVNGFSILQADSVDVVVALLKDHPHLHMPNSSIEVFEGRSMPGM